MTLVPVARFFNSFEAGLARSRLEAEGVPAILFDTEMSWEGMGGIIPIRLMVHQDDLEAARRILEPAPDTDAAG
jgi:hypothetical protein